MDVCKPPYVEQTRKVGIWQRVWLDNKHLEEASINLNIWHLVLWRKAHRRQGNNKSNNKNRYNLSRVCYKPAKVLIALQLSISSTNLISSSFLKVQETEIKMSSVVWKWACWKLNSALALFQKSRSPQGGPESIANWLWSWKAYQCLFHWSLFLLL